MYFYCLHIIKQTHMATRLYLDIFQVADWKTKIAHSSTLLRPEKLTRQLHIIICYSVNSTDCTTQRDS